MGLSLLHKDSKYLFVFLWLKDFFSEKDFHFQTNLKDLDSSYKVDLDLPHCFGRKNTILCYN